jgi:hypothetical protein
MSERREVAAPYQPRQNGDDDDCDNRHSNTNYGDGA